MSAITLCAPRRLASMADRMLASSELVSAANTSALSMFSSISSSSSAASPFSTMVFSSSSETRARAPRVALDELDLVVSSRALARRRKPMLPPPAITTRRTGSSSLAQLAHDAADVVARGEEEHLVAVLDDRVALGRDAAAVAVDGHDARLDLGQVLAAARAGCGRPAGRPAARARRPGAPCRRRNPAPAARRGSGSAARRSR